MTVRLRRTNRRRTRTTRTRAAFGLLLLAVAVLIAACGQGALRGDQVVTVTSTATAAVTSSGVPAPKVRYSVTPAFGTTDLAPDAKVSLTVFSGTISDLTVKGDDGAPVTGTLSDDESTWTLNQRLGYNTTYTFTGTAAAEDGSGTVPISGTLTTVKPEKTVRASFQIPPGTTVGVAAPIIITFAEPIDDKAAAERTFSVTTDRGPIEGSWGWLQDEDIQGTGTAQSIVHFRPAEYWPAYTNVHVEAKLAGVKYGNGAWGQEDITTDFTIGRKQVVQADVTSFHMVVLVDDKVVKNYPVSYGKESVPGRATVSGVHVVTEKHPEFAMCNQQFDYCGVNEKWAVRINNNGEFIHENPQAAPYLGKENVSHGCINMGSPDAEEYYNSALYGDPVEVSNTGAQMSEKDYIYDWIYPYDKWKSLSAL